MVPALGGLEQLGTRRAVGAVRAGHLELAELLGQRHLGQQRVDLLVDAVALLVAAAVVLAAAGVEVRPRVVTGATTATAATGTSRCRRDSRPRR